MDLTVKDVPEAVLLHFLTGISLKGVPGAGSCRGCGVLALQGPGAQGVSSETAPHAH